MKKAKEHPKICVVNIQHKCGCCNFDSGVAYYFSNEPEPELEADGERLTNGVCAECFLEIIIGNEVIMK